MINLLLTTLNIFLFKDIYLVFLGANHNITRILVKKEGVIMLTGKNRSYLRGEANSLNPIVHVGKDGITESVIEQLDEALEDHELLKVRILESTGRTTRSAAEELATATGSEVVQVIGGIAVLFRQRDEDSNFKL